jgi:hypothetical protein
MIIRATRSSSNLFPRPVRSGAAALLLLCGCLAAGPAAASPFKITGLDAASNWEIKIIAETEDTASEHEVEAPVLDITAPIRPGLETSVTFGRGWAKSKGGPLRQGFLDTEWAVKWEVVRMQEDASNLAVTTEPALFLPTGSRAVADHRWGVEVPLIFGKDYGPVGLRALVGYAHPFGGGHDEALMGGLVTYRLTEVFKVGAELSGSMPTVARHDYETAFDVGAIWEFAPGIEIQGRIGRTLRRAPGDEPATNFAIYLEKAF